ncbi:MAG: tRNA epoxyqueuosine(34) reductase QueG [Flavobacteriales bacterium]|nr:MAG: tRNA epoxyqueuosine(34) reductase QueG [Flavobacteriales bacterium]
MTQAQKNAERIKLWAKDLGFLSCGISKAEFLEEEAPRLDAWLKRDYQGSMQWMENHYDKRLDPTLLVPGAKSVVSLLLNYFPEKEPQHPDAPKISRYAYGKDYHTVMKDKLYVLLQKIRDEIGEVDGRCFVDSAPVMERAWAKKSGLGWIGKHSLLLTKSTGSFYFIGELIIDLDLAPDNSVADYCGSCTRCMDACPTDAIPEPYVVDSNRCISHLTIEYKEAIPSWFSDKMDNWAFGCDICQEVCPWNRFSKPHTEKAFDPHPDLLQMNKSEWMEITEEVFREIFRHSAVKRTKYTGLKRNLDFIRSNS